MGTPIINQPNVGVLGVGAVKKQPVVVEVSGSDSIAIRSMMILTLGFDHRLIDGAGGSKFVESVKKNIQNLEIEGFVVMPTDNVLKLYTETIQSSHLHYGYWDDPKCRNR